MTALGDRFVDAMKTETGATEGWARFNAMLASGMLREAAALTTQVARRDHPVRQARPPGPVACAPPWGSASASRPGTRR